MKLYVEHLRLNNGGYTSRGVYYGNVPGTKIYRVSDEDGEIDAVVRAKDAKTAREMVSAKYKVSGSARDRRRPKKRSSAKKGAKRRSVRVKSYVVKGYTRRKSSAKRDASKKRRTPKKRASGGPHGFSGKGKKPGSYYISVYDGWLGGNTVVAQNFSTHAAAEKYARGKKLKNYKIWQY